MKLSLLASFTLAATAAVSGARAEKISVAAAADLKFTLDEIIVTFKATHPGHQVDVIYGSSGKIAAQIEQGAPYDLFLSADISYPRELAKKGLTASDVSPYALGRIVLWSATYDASKLTLADLNDPKFVHIAIANPQHAPYGKRAEEALRAAGVWDKIQAKLVYGDNVAQTAQFVQTGNAQVGVIALSLAIRPELSSKGGYWLIPDKLHQPLEQGYVITKHAAHNPLAKQFADYLALPAARTIMTKYGFCFPGDSSPK